MVEIILTRPVKLGPGTRVIVKQEQADELVSLGAAKAAPHEDTRVASTPAPAAVPNAGKAAGDEQGDHHEGEGETVEDTSAPTERVKSKTGRGK